MEVLFTFLDNFISKPQETYENELDKIYLDSYILGQTSAIDFLKKHFPATHELVPSDLLKVGNERDTYVALRTSASEETDFLKETEKSGYYSGRIQMMNEAYIFLVRYSSVLSKNKEKEGTKN